MNTMTEQEAYLRLAALCAQAEHCEYEMQEKMRRWEIADDAQARVMQRLITERYVDDERFARAFANDKVKYNKWDDARSNRPCGSNTLPKTYANVCSTVSMTRNTLPFCAHCYNRKDAQ